MKIVVLDGFAVNPGDLDWSVFQKFGSITIYESSSEAEALARCTDADVVFTNRVKITSCFLDKCPLVKLVSALGTGYDMIDTTACETRGVCVCNIPAYSSDTVAQFALQHLFRLTTDFEGLCNIVKSGKWTGIPGFAYQNVAFTELAEKTIGLLGFGGIGRRMGELCTALHMKVYASTRTHTTGEDSGVRFLPLDEMLPLCDYISVHCPLNSETYKMVDKNFIAKMKDGAMLINTARGAILDEQAVADALNSGKLAGAGLDVLETEPASPNNPLLKAKNCVITPHAAWTAKEARQRIISISLENLEHFANYGKPLHQVF